MKIRLGVNGFGRIGRTIMRSIEKESAEDLEIVHINDLTDKKTIAHLLKYDSVHGAFTKGVHVTEDGIRIGHKEITVSATRDPSEIPWKEKNIDIVLECTGHFRDRAGVERHLKTGVPKVLVSAPTKGEDATIVVGVNHHHLQASHVMVSCASCTTNCLAPVAKVLHENWGIENGLMTTIHSYTNDQQPLDLPHSDLRRARAAAMNMIPTSTGAAKAIGLVLPDLKGKIDGSAVRVPTPNVSLVDTTFVLQRETSEIAINKAFAEAASGELNGILGYSEEPLVSIDFNGDSHSGVVDAAMTKVTGGRLAKVLAWYDNETGFSHRMGDLARLMAQVSN